MRKRLILGLAFVLFVLLVNNAFCGTNEIINGYQDYETPLGERKTFTLGDNEQNSTIWVQANIVMKNSTWITYLDLPETTTLEDVEANYSLFWTFRKPNEYSLTVTASPYAVTFENDNLKVYWEVTESQLNNYPQDFLKLDYQGTYNLTVILYNNTDSTILDSYSVIFKVGYPPVEQPTYDIQSLAGYVLVCVGLAFVLTFLIGEINLWGYLANWGLINGLMVALGMLPEAFITLTFIIFITIIYIKVVKKRYE